MQIQTFKNMKGVIHGHDPKRIDCDRDGVLKIGDTEVKVISGGDSILPLLFYGASGDYAATFTDVHGDTYNLETVNVREGRIAPPSPVSVEIMELRCRADSAEDECRALKESISELSKIFDTNSLNFLIG